MRHPELVNRETTDGLWNEVMTIANTHYDGHLTLFKFTTEWKAAFRTEDELRLGIDPVTHEIYKNPMFVTGATFHRVLERLIEAYEAGKYLTRDFKIPKNIERI